NFIPILVNRDERPDIDSIYQKASYIIGQGSGWPLNLFLNTEGKPFAGITYKMNEGKDYFKTMIDKAIELYKTNYEKVLSRSQVIIDAIKPVEVVPSEIREELLQNPEEDIVKEIDFEYGGFKKTPKFPPFAHIDLLLWKYWIRPKPWVLNAIEKTLKGMIYGGLYDNIEGGFHRYCIDNAWMIPHFEKLAVDNAWHIINFLDAYIILKDPFYREIAIETIDYIRKNLFSEEGFFCPSQFADSFYYTWEENELQEISPMTIALVDGKSMVDGRFILIGRDRELIKQLRDKFLLKRKQKSYPEIDKTLYSYVNGICAEAFIKAWRVIKDKDLLNKAIMAIDKTLSYLFAGENFYRTKENSPALIDDYAYIISALISAYEVSGEQKYIDKAV
ncbi:thioredoxin domain-containing protein, partial [Candidatus Aerophobetes bacterium]|nr:thioredoxin domain-containing protein [Candidatus Aerophobetes bacterium]